MHKIFFAIISLFVPKSRIKNHLFRLMGAKVSPSAKVGFSLILNTNLDLEAGASIGHFNLITSRGKLELQSNASLGHFNQITGNFSLRLNESARISNFVLFRGPRRSVFKHNSSLVLGDSSIITSSHYFDLSESIYVGDFSVIGGRDSKFWTHGFLHVNEGKTRFIKLESIRIGSGVYIGSNCTINPGSIIEKNVNVVSATTVNGRLIDGGVYGSSSIRKIMQVDESIINDTYELDEDHSSGHPRIIKRK
ncbi:hypothetical protein ABF162_14660 [Vibrio coralliilyticus]|uniref:acyltransferase n=1 Tax=Vibrio coralliilyticus TaxID=190893 RepID=UPI00345E9C92